MDNQDLTMTRRLQGKDEQIADLLEALEQMSSWFDADGYAFSVPPRVFVFNMREAIRKTKENER